jgi:hypothetical protein
VDVVAADVNFAISKQARNNRRKPPLDPACFVFGRKSLAFGTLAEGQQPRHEFQPEVVPVSGCNAAEVALREVQGPDQWSTSSRFDAAGDGLELLD